MLTRTDPSRYVQAHDLQPHDLSTRWNVALVQQKGLEILIGLPESKRTVAELTTALADAEASQAYVHGTYTPISLSSTLS